MDGGKPQEAGDTSTNILGITSLKVLRNLKVELSIRQLDMWISSSGHGSNKEWTFVSHVLGEATAMEFC